MIVGIVGSEAAKFTALGEERAKLYISGIITDPEVTEVVSGDCHLGGIDQWAAEIGREWKRTVTEFPPKVKSWERGYKPRNLQIAARSNIVYCITVDRLPEDFKGMRFPLCYHCNQRDHVKSGGCWTMHRAVEMGKRGGLFIVKNYD